MVSEGVNLATRYGCKYTEVSAILNMKVDELLVGILRQIRLQPERETPTNDPGTSTRHHTQQQQDGGCLPRAAAGILRKLFKKPQYLSSKSCENLLAL